MMIGPALAELGVKRFLLAIHDVSFPSDPDEDIGRGAPSTRAAARLFEYATSLGFTGLQLGPQGQTDPGNPSPYDSTIFSRHLATIAIASFRAGGPYAGLVDETVVDGLVTKGGPGRARHSDAHAATRALVMMAFGRMWREQRWRSECDAFVAANPWAHADALYMAAELVRSRGQSGDVPERYLFGQWLAHEEHARVRSICGRLGLALYGDLQVGYSQMDAANHAKAFLPNFYMGAPPSRTNPDGQPWNYPVLDPDQLDAGNARALLLARIDKVFAEYDSVRIDHPHGLVCPWVYRAGSDVRDGTRLYESPDDAALARYAVARDAQIDHARPRYHDQWVRELDDDQVARHARLFDLFAECAARHGRAMADVSCEVLSTMPYPLGRVLDRHGLGRWRVVQKANLDDATDVYRTENAKRADWVMIGNHDTAPIFALVRSWSADVRAKWARHLTARLSLRGEQPFDDDGFLATAMLAELFACDAENVSIFWADLFGETERFNAPGTVSDANWSLRLPADFERMHRDRLDKHAALDIRLALALALEAKGSTSGLAAALRGRA